MTPGRRVAELYALLSKFGSLFTNVRVPSVSPLSAERGATQAPVHTDLPEAHELVAGITEMLQQPATVSRGPEPEPEPDPIHTEFLLKELRAALDAQWDQWKHTDTRVQFLLGWLFAGVSAGAALGVGKAQPTRTAFAFLTVGGLLALWSLVLLVIGYLSKGFYRPPEPTGLIDQYFDKPTLDTQLMLLGTIADAYAENQRNLDQRQLLLSRAVLTAGEAGVIVVLGAACQLLGI